MYDEQSLHPHAAPCMTDEIKNCTDVISVQILSL